MIRVAVAILKKDGKILICQRKRNSRYGLKWEFPGGKVESGETVLECLKRELAEELSIAVNSASPTDVQTAFYEDGGKFEVHYYTVEQYRGEPINKAFEQIQWVSPKDLRNLDILEGNRSFVEKLTGGTA
jgi:8-oxo-dGTP diphosphatase